MEMKSEEGNLDGAPARERLLFAEWKSKAVSAGWNHGCQGLVRTANMSGAQLSKSI